MTTISDSDVQTLADLSALELSDEEKTNLKKDLENILSNITKLNTLDTDGVEPQYQVTGLENVWRTDEVNQPLEASKLVELAPKSRDGQIEVPKVL